MPDDPRTVPETGELAFLQLLHLSDSALPIGGMAHSFGLETMVERGLLTVNVLEDFLRGYLQEAGALEAAYCRAAHRCAVQPGMKFSEERLPGMSHWLAVNDELSARKPARESRAASGAMGQRLLMLAVAMGDDPLVAAALQASRQAGSLVHHSTAFGFVAGSFGHAEDRAALGYLHQSIMGLVSACQRLLPLGQTAAARILWSVKSEIAREAMRSECVAPNQVCCFLPEMDWGAMEHPGLRTRLFIS